MGTAFCAIETGDAQIQDGIRQISISPDDNWGVSGASIVGQTNSDVMVLTTIDTISRTQHQSSSHTHTQ